MLDRHSYAILTLHTGDKMVVNDFDISLCRLVKSEIEMGDNHGSDEEEFCPRQAIKDISFAINTTLTNAVQNLSRKKKRT